GAETLRDAVAAAEDVIAIAEEVPEHRVGGERRVLLADDLQRRDVHHARDGAAGDAREIRQAGGQCRGLFRGPGPRRGGPRLRARLVGAVEAAAQHHAAEETGGDEDRREQNAANHCTSILRGAVAIFGSMTVSTPSCRSAVMPSSSTASTNSKVRRNDP